MVNDKQICKELKLKTLIIKNVQSFCKQSPAPQKLINNWPFIILEFPKYFMILFEAFFFWCVFFKTSLSLYLKHKWLSNVFVLAQIINFASRKESWLFLQLSLKIDLP